ncbi:MAG: hypothetical protein ACRD20_20580 [Terriglobales bacterium]
MSSHTLPVLAHPEFPHVFQSAIDRYVERISLAQDLGTCWFEDEHCDCHQLATVHLLGSDFNYCARHFAEVTRG